MKFKEKLYSIALASTAMVLFLIFVSSTTSAAAAQSALPMVTETQITTNGSAYSPAIYGDTIVWTDSRNGQYNHDIYMYNISTSQETQITTSGDASGSEIYDDRIVWSDYRNGEALGNIYMYDFSTHKETQITTNGLTVNPVIYDDRIVWMVDSNGFDIYVYNLSTSQETQITTSGLASSPDIYGDRIVWTDHRNGKSDIYMYNILTSQETQISYSGSAPSCDIYGDRIVWQDSRNNNGDGSSDIYMYDLSTSQETRITASGHAGIPVIYGNRIVWQDWRNGEAYGNIYMYNISTSEETQITTSGTAEYPAIYDDRIVWMNTEEQAYIEYKHDIYMGTIEPSVSTGTYAYITNSGDNTVSVIDTATNTVTATVNVGWCPVGVAINSAGTKIYVANDYDNTISVIDTATNAVIATVTVGSAPYVVAVNPAGTKVYVANYYGDSVSIIDTATNTVTATVDLEGGGWSTPQGIVVNPAGTKVYVANTGSNTVSVIDTATNTVTATVNVEAPWGVAVTPDGTKVYVANYAGSNTVSVIDTATNNVTATVNVGDGPVGVAVNPTGTKVYVANKGSSNVSVIDTATNTVTATVNVENGPEGVAVNPTGTKVYVANKGSDTVSVIDTAINTVVATVTVGNDPTAFGQFIGEIPIVPVEEPGESTITVGQNASTPEITQKFNDSYYRNGGLDVLGKPTTEVHSAFGFELQDFPEMPATDGGVIMYNSSNSTAYFIHGAIWDKYYAYPDADKARLGSVASDEKVADASPQGTVGKYTEFENGCIHWISNKEGENEDHLQRGQSFVTYGKLNKMYDEMGGTGSALGFPIQDQEENDGYGYCKFEGGYIDWDDAAGVYKVYYNSAASISCEILAPVEQGSFKKGESIVFSGKAEGGNPPYAYAWIIDGEGFSTMYSEYTSPALSLGEHTVQLQVSDSLGNKAESATVHFAVYTKKVAVIPIKFKESGTISNPSFGTIKDRCNLIQQYYSNQSYEAEYIDFDLYESNTDGGWFKFSDVTESDGRSQIKDWEKESDTSMWEKACKIAGIELVDTGKQYKSPTGYDVALVLYPTIAFTSHSSSSTPFSVCQAAKGYGEWAHELGHSLYGLQDKASDEQGGGNIGNWGIMGLGYQYNPPAPIIGFEKNQITNTKTSWMPYKDISVSGITYSGNEYTVSYLDDSTLLYEGMLRLNTGGSNAFIFEGRRDTEGTTTSSGKNYPLFDGANKGIVIYHVDNSNMIWRETPAYDVYDSVSKWGNDVTISLDESKYLNSFTLKATCLSAEDKVVKLKIETVLPTKYEVWSIATTTTDSLYDSLIGVPDGSNPDVDLHVITSDGRRVGVDYANDTYYNEIEGAETSGNIFGGGPEWIAIPDGIDATAYVTISPDMKTLLSSSDSASVEVTSTLAVYDENGDMNKSEPVSINISSKNLADQFTIPLININSLPSITNLQSTNGTTWLNWTWTNPSDSNFNHTEIYLNNIFQTNTSAEYFNATGLEPETDYTIGTRTVDIHGNVNETWLIQQQQLVRNSCLIFL